MTDLVDDAAHALVTAERAEHGLPPCRFDTLTEEARKQYQLRASAVLSIPALIDAAEREAAASKRVEELEAEIVVLGDRGAHLLIAYHVAVNSLKGIVPMDEFYDPALAASILSLSPRTEQEQGG